RIQHGGISLAADRDRDLIARRRGGGGAADNVRQNLLTHLKNVLASQGFDGVSYKHLKLPTITVRCRSRWSPYQ
ncbi:hypothetical protein, partial [Enterobacter hormaechei]